MKKNIIYTLENEEIKYLTKSDENLSFLINKIGSISYKLETDYFEFIINTIIGQMLSNKAATAISNRLYVLCNNILDPLNINKLNIDKLRAIGISSAKSKYILEFTKFINDNPKYFKYINKLNDNQIINEMIKIRGIGIWSIKMYLIFVLNRMDILPYEGWCIFTIIQMVIFNN